jgi:hypothetical protein
MQLALLPSAGQIVVPDRKCRKTVVEALARLLLEAADDGAGREQHDDPA